MMGRAQNERARAEAKKKKSAFFFSPPFLYFLEFHLSHLPPKCGNFGDSHIVPSISSYCSSLLYREPHCSSSFDPVLSFMAYQERLFLAIEVPLPEDGTLEQGNLSHLLQKREELRSSKNANGWVHLLHITLYFFQHDSKKDSDTVYTADDIIRSLSAPESSFSSFHLELSKIVFCGTRTLRLKVEDDSQGLQKLHYGIVDAMKLPPLEGGWEGGHVSLYRFNNAETKALAGKGDSSKVEWTSQLIEAYQSIGYAFKVKSFNLYKSESSGYVKLFSFDLKSE